MIENNEVLLLDRLQTLKTTRTLQNGLRNCPSYKKFSALLTPLNHHLKTDITNIALQLNVEQVRHIYFAATGKWVSAKSVRTALKRFLKRP